MCCISCDCQTISYISRTLYSSIGYVVSPVKTLSMLTRAIENGITTSAHKYEILNVISAGSLVGLVVGVFSLAPLAVILSLGVFWGADCLWRSEELKDRVKEVNDNQLRCELEAGVFPTLASEVERLIHCACTLRDECAEIAADRARHHNNVQLFERVHQAVKDLVATPFSTEETEAKVREALGFGAEYDVAKHALDKQIDDLEAATDRNEALLQQLREE